MNVGSAQYNSNVSSYQSISNNNSGPPDFQAIMEERMAQLEEAVDSGEIDVATLQEEMQNRFGDAVEEAFTEDDDIDFDKLLEIIQSQAPEMGQGMQEMSGPPPGPPPNGSGSGEFKLDASQFQSKLEKRNNFLSLKGWSPKTHREDCYALSLFYCLVITKSTLNGLSKASTLIPAMSSNSLPCHPTPCHVIQLPVMSSNSLSCHPTPCHFDQREKSPLVP